MKVKLSKSQWEQIGKTAGWIKTSGIDEDFSDIYGVIRPFAELVQKYRLDRNHYAIDPNHYEDIEVMRVEVRKAEAFVAAFKKAMEFAAARVADADEAIKSLHHEYPIGNPAIEQERRDFRMRADSGDPTSIAQGEQ